jgi:hypothetical protein
LCLVRWQDQATEGPRLQLPRTRRQDDAIKSLHSFVYLADHKASSFNNNDFNKELDKLLLEVLESIYYHQPSHTRPLSCIIDIVIILLSMKNDGSFRKASGVTHLCAIFQYSMRCTATHSLRLHTMGCTQYEPLSPPKSTTEDGIIEEEDDTFLT